VSGNFLLPSDLSDGIRTLKRRGFSRIDNFTGKTKISNIFV
jgi:hypothetical protein